MPKEQQGKVAKLMYKGEPAELKHGSVVIAAIDRAPTPPAPPLCSGPRSWLRRPLTWGCRYLRRGKSV